MRYRSLRKWDSPSQSENLVFFAQLFEESFFDFSLDTYKPSAMNSSLLCLEALDVIDFVKSGDIAEPNIEHVVNELCDSLSKDLVAQSLIDVDLKDINGVLRNTKKSHEEKRTTIEILAIYLSLDKYKKRNEELLIASIISGADKSLIRSLARSYGTTLINFGFSDNHIYDTILDFFYSSTTKIKDNSEIKNFINEFPSSYDEYLFIYKGVFLFKELEDACNKFKINISDVFPKIDGITIAPQQRRFLEESDGVYITLDNMKARDFNEAKKKADGILKMFGTLFSLYHHKEELLFKDECLVINKAKNIVKKKASNVNTMHKCIDMKTKKSSIKLNELITGFNLDEESFAKFTNAARLHSLALGSGSEQNQIVNLWIALESIIPTTSSSSNINNIIDSTIPFLNFTYYLRLVRRLGGDLLNWKPSLFKSAISGISGNDISIRLVKMFSLPMYAANLTMLKNGVGDFHLLKDRLDFFESIFSEPLKITNGLESHGIRVGRQIRRIYRARNMIVHTGNIPSYTSILIENLHDYLDSILSALIELNVSHRKIFTIEQGFKVMDLKYSKLKRAIESKGFIFTEENIDEIFN